jgi:cytidylate kinase
MAVITVSRTPGSLGDLVAEGVAQQLGYRLVGRQELIQLAQDISGPDVGWERSPELRERSPSFWERLNEERRRYASVLRRVTTYLAEQDDVVIVGLGAGQLLKGLGNVLRVQVVAPQDVRLERIMERGYDDRRGPLTRDQARDVMRQRERESAGYMRYLFNMDWMDPQQWDLVVNTGSLSVPQAVASMAERGDLEPSAADRQRLRNMLLSSQVESAILGDVTVWVNGLRVVAQNGRVRLEGEVMSEEDRELVEHLVQGVEGVYVVDNELRIQPPPLSGL